MNPKFIYVFDSLCSWCYAFYPELVKTFNEFSNYDIQLVSGGMFTGESRKHALDMIPPNQVKTMYENVINFGGAEISEQYLNGLILSQNYLLDSERTSTGFVIFRYHNKNPRTQLDFIHDTQTEMYVQGIDPNSDEYYTNVLPKYDMKAETFLKKLKESYYQDEAKEDWQYAIELNAQSFPQLFIQTQKDEYYLVAKGYTKYEDIRARVLAIISEAYS